MTGDKRDLFCATLFCLMLSPSGSAHETDWIYSTCQALARLPDSLLCSVACPHFNTKRQVKNFAKRPPFTTSAFITQSPVRFPERAAQTSVWAQARNPGPGVQRELGNFSTAGRPPLANSLWQQNPTNPLRDPSLQFSPPLLAKDLRPTNSPWTVWGSPQMPPLRNHHENFSERS